MLITLPPVFSICEKEKEGFLLFNFKMEDNTKKQKEKVKEIDKKKKIASYIPSWEEIWHTGYPTSTGNHKCGIFSTKLTEKDKEKLQEVKKAIENGIIGTNVESLRQFTKTHAQRLYTLLVDSKRTEKLEELVKNKPSNYILVENRESMELLKAELQNTEEIFGFDIETFGTENKEDALDPWKGKIAGFSVSNSKYHFYLPLMHTEQTELNKEHAEQIVQAYFLMEELKPYLEQIKTVMHNAQFDCKFMWVNYGIDMVSNLHADTRIMAFMLDENRHGSTHRLKDLVSDWLKIPSDNFDELFKEPFNKVPLRYCVYAMKDTEVTLSLYNWMLKYLEKPELSDIKKLIFEVEMPVCRIFIWADIRGIGFNAKESYELDNQFEQELKSIEKQIFVLFGKEINLSSPLQLKKVLYEELELPDLDKGSTGVKTLKKIKSEHPAIPLILEYRQLDKLRSSFTKSLPTKIQKDGRIHPTHNTLGCTTGRFSCKSPNTQQIPSKRPEIRKLFTPAKGKIFISYDMSQIELRIAAEMSGEEIMLEAFNKGQDMHSTTASRVFNVPYEQIEERKDIEGSKEKLYRRVGKQLNFAILYGVSAKGLSEMLSCSQKEAQKYIDSFFEGYPKISEFMKKQTELVKSQGYVTDLYGRKRRFQYAIRNADNYKLYGIFRQSQNFPVQSSAGTLLKKAIIDVDKLLPTLESDCHILLQIHDEIVLEADEGISYEEVMKIKETIEKADTTLSVPIKSDAEVSVGKWMEIVSMEEYFNKAN